MHMADALISPAVGGVMCAASAGLAYYSARTIQDRGDDRLVPLMGVAGSFVFAAQMINFGIPGTGSSGHLGGGLLLAALLGPHAAFLVMVSILLVQALFFADGGLLALGCNIFNLGVFPCFVAYPLVFRPLAGDGRSWPRLLAASLLAAVAALELGALGVTLQTTLSGRTELPFQAFLLVMLGIHLAIGVIEGLATATVLGFVAKARPELFPVRDPASDSRLGAAAALLLAALLIGGFFSWFASDKPDGLEWSIERTAGVAELDHGSQLHRGLADLQQRAAFLPDYGFRTAVGGEASGTASWPMANAGLSVSGIVGSLLVLAIAGVLGYLSRSLGRRRVAP